MKSWLDEWGWALGVAAPVLIGLAWGYFYMSALDWNWSCLLVQCVQVLP